MLENSLHFIYLFQYCSNSILLLTKDEEFFELKERHWPFCNVWFRNRSKVTQVNEINQ